ncbi:MAG TPA: HlyD family efflux transporter periplasmic adaptor subunit, partial [Candidatus Lustribacter sp.]|nr:HlyD family efflux transporter periplasmic adaptor subunit [Candidatus Lustribacter sp.]
VGTTTGGATGTASGTGAGSTSRSLQLRYARQDRDRALTALTAARAKAGPMVPASEVIFMRTLPARVVSMNAPLGRAVPTDMLVLSSGAMQVKAKLQPYQRARVKVGQKVQIFSDDTGKQYPGVVSSVGATPVSDSGGSGGSGDQGQGQGQGSSGEQGAGGDEAALYYLVMIKPTKAIPASLQGLAVRVTVEKSASAGQVLAVPSAAVSSRSDGASIVTVQDAAGALRTVVVTPGVSGDGYVEVSGGGIRAGDAVVVGQ